MINYKKKYLKYKNKYLNLKGSGPNEDQIKRNKELQKTLFSIRNNLTYEYNLVNWIDKDKLNWDGLCENPNAAIFILQMKNRNKVQSRLKHLALNSNTKVLKLLEKLLIENNYEVNRDILKNLSDNKNPISINLIDKILDNNKTIRGIAMIFVNIISNNILNEDMLKFLKKHKSYYNYLPIYIIEGYMKNPDTLMLKKQNILYFFNFLNYLDIKIDSVTSYIKYLANNKSPNAIKFLRFFVESENLIDDDLKMCWMYLTTNPNDEAIDLLIKRKNLINWDYLSMNPNSKALDLLIHEDKIDYNFLVRNTNPKVIILLKKYLIDNPSLFNWRGLSLNHSPEALNIIKENIDEMKDIWDDFTWSRISSNPLIFEKYNVNNDIVDYTIENKN
jgi:hypothetical protein